MDKRIIIAIAIILFICTLVFLFFFYFEIKPAKRYVYPSGEYYSNNYLALERWLNGAGLPVTKHNEYELDFYIVNEANLNKTILITNPENFLTMKSPEDISDWIKKGRSVIICINDSVMENILLSDFGITAGLTPYYHTYSDDNTPDYHWKFKFSVEDDNEYIINYDIHNNIRIIRIPIQSGMLTIMGLPSFMWNSGLQKEANARLTWELLTKGGNADGVIIVQYVYREQEKTSSLFGTLMKRGNLIPVLISVLIIIITGFWMVIPVFGQVKEDRQKSIRPIKDRFSAEISFLKKYKGLYYYDEALDAIRSIKNQQPRPKGTGYVASPEELHSGFNTLFKRPEGRGIKPLSTNKDFKQEVKK